MQYFCQRSWRRRISIIHTCINKSIYIGHHPNHDLHSTFVENRNLQSHVCMQPVMQDDVADCAGAMRSHPPLHPTSHPLTHHRRAAAQCDCRISVSACIVWHLPSCHRSAIKLCRNRRKTTAVPIHLESVLYCPSFAVGYGHGSLILTAPFGIAPPVPTRTRPHDCTENAMTGSRIKGLWVG